MDGELEKEIEADTELVDVLVLVATALVVGNDEPLQELVLDVEDVNVELTVLNDDTDGLAVEETEDVDELDMVEVNVESLVCVEDKVAAVTVPVLVDEDVELTILVKEAVAVLLLLLVLDEEWVLDDVGVVEDEAVDEEELLLVLVEEVVEEELVVLVLVGDMVKEVVPVLVPVRLGRADTVLLLVENEVDVLLPVDENVGRDEELPVLVDVLEDDDELLNVEDDEHPVVHVEVLDILGVGVVDGLGEGIYTPGTHGCQSFGSIQI